MSRRTIQFRRYVVRTQAGAVDVDATAAAMLIDHARAAQPMKQAKALRVARALGNPRGKRRAA